MMKFKLTATFLLVFMFSLFFSPISFSQKGAGASTPKQITSNPTGTTGQKPSAGNSTDVHIQGIYALLAVIVSGIISYLVGRNKGREGKMQGFDTFASPLQLHGNPWRLKYQDPDGSQKTGIVKIDQTGCRITGLVTTESDNRIWIMEGAASGRYACYIYTDSNPNIDSFGAVVLKMSGDGKTLEGKWIGWSPTSGQQEEGEVALEKS